VLNIEIIPTKQIINSSKYDNKSYNYKAICIFSALGFFLDDDTYFEGEKVLKPATNYIFKDNKIVDSVKYFKWNYSPRDINLRQATEEFTELFESIVKEQIDNRTVILPLSGGLDSRTQAAALKNIGANVNAYSYCFLNGHNETKYSERIAKISGFPFKNFTIERGYLWKCIDRLAEINQCYSEFTHPRQMAFVDEYASLGEVFSLGHWGDVLFDDMGVPDDLPFQNQVDAILKKIIKKGGQELAEALWKEWEIEGNFMDYLRSRVEGLLKEIDIPNSANAQIRAFKSLYWAPRWTSVNLSVFESVRPITLPYYDNRMCEFICTVPEKLLSSRQIQIEYLKLRAPKLAKITWQDHRPFNLYNYQWDRTPWNLLYRIWSKINRTLNSKPLIQRNWELQFLGPENQLNLEKRLLKNNKFSNLTSVKLTENFYSKFLTENPVKYSHPISMLLTINSFINLKK
jgi:rhodanese-related sulfurtransferase